LTILETLNLHAGYGKTVIIQDVSIRVGRDEVIALIGPNGSGKSTLLKSVVGLARVFSGQVVYEGRPLNGSRTHEIIRIGIGYVPQVENVFTNLTVEENLEMGAYIRKDNGVRRDLEEIFELFPELKPYRKRRAATLSGGERQMLAIGRALMSRPKLLILDEPTANLAPKAVAKVLSKIETIKEAGIPVLMVEQNVKKALQICSRVYLMVSGRCVYEGDPKSLVEDERLRKMCIGVLPEDERKPVTC